MIGAPFTPWFPVIISFAMGLLGLVATVWVVYLIVNGFQRRQQLKAAADFQARLLDRIGSAREFGEFLNSAEGERFLKAVTPKEKAGPRLFQTVQSAAITLFVGIAIAIYAGLGAGSLDGDLPSALAFVAAVLIATGLALALSAAIALKWSGRLGLVESAGDARTSEPSRL